MYVNTFSCQEEKKHDIHLLFNTTTFLEKKKKEN
jgi:hypothetical protein